MGADQQEIVRLLTAILEELEHICAAVGGNPDAED